MSNGVNKLELGCDSLFYGLWHIICVWAGQGTSQSWVMTSVPPRWHCTLWGWMLLFRDEQSSIACLWWVIWGRMGSCSEECESRGAPWDPVSPSACAVHRVKTQKLLLWISGSSKPGAPRTSRRAEFLRAVQTTGFAKLQCLTLHRASAPWSTFFLSLLCAGQQLPLWGCLGWKKGKLLYLGFSWRRIFVLKYVLKDCGIKTECLLLVNIVSLWTVSQ